MSNINLSVNGTQYSLEPMAGETLSTLLRQRLRLTGTKIGCDEAECGACTVLVNGEPVLSCMYPAGRANGKAIITIEGLAKEFMAKNLDGSKERLHPLNKPSSSTARCSADSASL